MSDDRAQDAATLRFYAAFAEVYTASGPGGVSRGLPGFLALLAPGARILDLGCGAGRDAEAMRAAGFAVEAMDGTPEIAQKAAERLGQPVRVMRFDQLDAVEAYDAIWASASLLHVPRAALPGVLARVHRALKPGGVHFASYKGGGTEGRDSHGRYFNYLTRDQLMPIYAQAADWVPLSVVEYIGGGYQGGQGPWVAVTLRRPD
ncbi:MAG: class I SAM-dependent methyltransferase [Cypionkella sp.]